MKEIILNRKNTKSPNYKKYVALVDDADFNWLNQWDWSYKKHGYTYYAHRSVTIDGKRKEIKMHRLIMDAMPGEMIDHRDRRGWNNQRPNLRRSTSSQNNANSKSRENSTSKYMGVSLHISNKKYKTKNNEIKTSTSKGWQVTIGKDKKIIYVGYFKTEIEAAMAYDVAAIQHHGEFARLNFPSGITTGKAIR